jgi:hypothetical protein
LDRVIADLGKESASLLGVVLEVEPPERALDAERDLRARRIRFYERHGGEVVAGAPAYRVPSTVDDEVFPMTLMWIPLLGTKSPFAGELLHSAVSAILNQDYEFDRDNAFVRSVLADLIL